MYPTIRSRGRLLALEKMQWNLGRHFLSLESPLS